MSPERLNADQRLLFECLLDIWAGESRKIVIAIMAALALAVGLIIGTLAGTRKSLRQTAAIAAGLNFQVQQNREMLNGMARDRSLERQRYNNLLAAFESVKRHQTNRRQP